MIVELRQLRYFASLAEHLHFRKTAELLHIAQPALSLQIRCLEEEMGVRLFERTSRSVELTLAGENYLLSVRRMLEQMDQAVHQAQDIDKGNAGTLRIGIVGSAMIGVLPKTIKLFQQKVPNVRLDLWHREPGEQIELLKRGEIDFAIVHAHLDDDELQTMVMARQQLVAALPRTTHFVNTRRIDLRKLTSYTAIVPRRHSMPGYYENVMIAYQLAGAVSRRVQHVSPLILGLNLVAANLGVALVPESFTSIRVPGVIYRPLIVSPPLLELVVAWRKDNRSALLFKLLNMLREACSAQGSISV
jgi:DNA-binding transcriptional LysR family regulator